MIFIHSETMRDVFSVFITHMLKYTDNGGITLCFQGRSEPKQEALFVDYIWFWLIME